MSVKQELPDMVVGTGGLDAAAGALLCVGSTSPHMADFFTVCMYCLDAPDYMPAGAMQHNMRAGQVYAKRGAA